MTSRLRRANQPDRPRKFRLNSASFANNEAEGLDCAYRHFHSVEELKDAGLVLAVIKFALFVDHYVAVLEVTENEMTVGDPFYGKRTYSRQEFSTAWRHCGIVLKRRPAIDSQRATNF